MSDPATSGPPSFPPKMLATYTRAPIVIDGNLDKPIWRAATAYSLIAMPGAAPDERLPLGEPGTVRLAWDERFLYLAADFQDSDVVAEGAADNLHHYQFGDGGELFLRPEDQSWYWEL